MSVAGLLSQLLQVAVALLLAPLLVGWVNQCRALLSNRRPLHSTLISGDAPRESAVGIVLAALSLVVMPLLARAKRRVAKELGSGALAAEAQQTSLCAYLSAILLGGLVLNATLGWSWADPVAALVMVPIIAKEGVEGFRQESACCERSA